MATRDDLCDWVVEALKENGGSARIVQVCKYIWEHYETELRKSGDLFYTWQYDVRWAGQKLRNNGTLKPAYGSRSAPWELSRTLIFRIFPSTVISTFFIFASPSSALSSRDSTFCKDFEFIPS